MRKLFLLLFVLPVMAVAQPRFGYYSSSSVLKSLPQYKQAMEEYEALRLRCDEEVARNEQELTRLYVAFLDGHRDFPEPILRKRQNELQNHVDNSVNFRRQLKRWMVEAKDSLLTPSYQALDAAIEKVCIACDFDYVVDADAKAYAYINPNRGFDITAMLLDVVQYPDKPFTEIEGFNEFAKLLKNETEVAVKGDKADEVEQADEVEIVQQEVATDVVEEQ